MKLGGLLTSEMSKWVRSRNSQAIKDGSANIFDFYLLRRVEICRLWPVRHITNPSPAYQKTIDAVRREREIEKKFKLDDILALKVRAADSSWNWWEVLGAIYLSREYNHPGTTTGVYFKSMLYVPSHGPWNLYFTTDKPAICYALIILKGHFPRPGHYWDAKSPEPSCYRRMCKDAEHFTPDYYIKELNMLPSLAHTWRFPDSIIKKGSFFMIQAQPSIPNKTVIGESGIFVLTNTVPWWLDAPISPD